MSLALFCRRAAIPSTGYISDVMNGKRKLNRKYAANVGAPLALNRLQSDYLELLVLYDNKSAPEELDRISEEIAQAAKRLRIRFESKTLTSSLAQALEVFCAFGLFSGNPTYDQLADLYGQKLEPALEALIKAGLIREKEEGSFEILADQVEFSDSEDGVSHLDFLRNAIVHAQDNLSLYDKRDEALFQSEIVSVAGSEYREFLGRLRDYSLKERSSIERSDADMLIRFNIQVYPSISKPSHHYEPINKG